MKINNTEYSKLVSNASPASPISKDCGRAFLIGGAICCLGQLLSIAYKSLPISPEISKSLVSISLIFLAAVLTGLGVFDKIAKFAGAGTLVPITGFSNAVTSAAIEYKSEGFIMGLGAKMFTIAGPVIVYGTVASVVYGLIYWITTLF